MPKTRRVGAVVVDSGTVIIADPAHVMTKKRYDKVADGIVYREVKLPLDLFDIFSNKNLVENYGRTVGAFDPQTVEPGFVVSRTQIGDGAFPVYAEYSDEGDLLSLTIRFDGEDEFEFEEDWLSAGSVEKLGDDDGT